MRQGVIFDMDGVLVDSGPPHAASWRALAAKHGLHMSEEDFAETFGQTSRDIIRRFWGAGLGADETRRIDAEKEALYRESIRGRIPMMADVHEMLHALRNSGLALAVASSGPPENIALVLEEGGLSAYFDAVVTGSDVEHGKPAPDCFLLAARRADLPPAQAIVVEDAPAGIQAARAAGMRAIGLSGTHTGLRLLSAGALLTVERLSQITPELIRDAFKAADVQEVGG